VLLCRPPHPNTRAPRACAETRRGAPAGGLKYGLYELFKVWLAGDTTALALPLPLLLLAAACAELVASTALCPYEAARIRLVADPSFAVGLLATLRRLVSEQGVYGVFGALPAMYLKMVPYTMAQLATYDGVTRALAAHLQGSGAAAASSSGSSSTDTLVRSSPAVQAGDLATFGIALVGAAAAALVASLASQPGDTLLSKLNQGRRALMPRTSVATQSGTPGGGGGLAMKSLAVRKQRDGGLIGGGATSSAIALGTATGAGSLVTSSDDESGVNGDDPPAQLGGMGGVGGEGGSTARASPSGAGGVDGAAQLGASRPHSSFGCGPMCALAARLGPAGLMLGWQARLMHTGASPGLLLAAAFSCLPRSLTPPTLTWQAPSCCFSCLSMTLSRLRSACPSQRMEPLQSDGCYESHVITVPVERGVVLQVEGLHPAIDATSRSIWQTSPLRKNERAYTPRVSAARLTRLGVPRPAA
jgi:hypothetical protein